MKLKTQWNSQIEQTLLERELVNWKIDHNVVQKEKMKEVKKVKRHGR